MTDFPAGLPSALNGSLIESDIDTTATDSNDLGIPNRRQMTTKVIRQFSYAIRIKQSDRSTLDTFYNTTVNQVGLFNWTHPITAEEIEVYFRARPIWRQYNFDTWEVQIELQEA